MLSSVNLCPLPIISINFCQPFIMIYLYKLMLTPFKSYMMAEYDRLLTPMADDGSCLK